MTKSLVLTSTLHLLHFSTSQMVILLRVANGAGLLFAPIIGATQIMPWSVGWIYAACPLILGYLFFGGGFVYSHQGKDDGYTLSLTPWLIARNISEITWTGLAVLLLHTPVLGGEVFLADLLGSFFGTLFSFSLALFLQKMLHIKRVKEVNNESPTALMSPHDHLDPIEVAVRWGSVIYSITLTLHFMFITLLVMEVLRGPISEGNSNWVMIGWALLPGICFFWPISLLFCRYLVMPWMRSRAYYRYPLDLDIIKAAPSEITAITETPSLDEKPTPSTNISLQNTQSIQGILLPSTVLNRLALHSAAENATPSPVDGIVGEDMTLPTQQKYPPVTTSYSHSDFNEVRAEEMFAPLPLINACIFAIMLGYSVAQQTFLDNSLYMNDKSLYSMSWVLGILIVLLGALFGGFHTYNIGHAYKHSPKQGSIIDIAMLCTMLTWKCLFLFLLHPARCNVSPFLPKTLLCACRLATLAAVEHKPSEWFSSWFGLKTMLEGRFTEMSDKEEPATKTLQRPWFPFWASSTKITNRFPPQKSDVEEQHLRKPEYHLALVSLSLIMLTLIGNWILSP